jgi:hypothetical protein
VSTRSRAKDQAYHRGKGQQKVTVEHVHVHAGGQAAVGIGEAPGEWFGRNRRTKPMDQGQRPKPPGLPLALWLSPRCGVRTRSATPCKSPAMANARCQFHGGKAPGAPKGNKNALKHGLYSAEVVAHRRKVGALLRAARNLMRVQRRGISEIDVRF